MDKSKEKNKYLKYAAIAAIFASFTFFSFSAFELYFTNKEEMWFTFWDIVPLFLTVTALSSVILFGIVFLVGKLSLKLGNVIVSLIFSIGLGFYIQGNYIVTDYGVLNGKTINWGEYTGAMIVSAAVWFACLVIPLVLLFVRSKWFGLMVKWISSFIIAIEVITIAVLFVTVGPGKESKPIITTENKFHISQDKNVIVFVVDTLDVSYTDAMLEQYPEVFTEFKDFTYYTDTSGSYNTTKGGLPFIVTGELYFNEQLYQDWLDQSYRQSRILNTASENGYEIDMYTNEHFSANSAEDVFTNVHSAEVVEIIDKRGFVKEYLQLISFRYMPDIVKPIFWVSQNEFANYKGVGPSIRENSINNFKFYKEFAKEGLVADRTAPVLKFYHLFGVHLPIIINERVELVKPEQTSILKAARGCFRIIEDYISQLKALGQYENSTIIIMADHGASDVYPQCPTFMIKEASAKHERLVLDDTPTSYVLKWQDIMTSVLRDEQKSVHDIVYEKSGQERPFYFYSFDTTWDARYLPDIYEYRFSASARQKNLIYQALPVNVYKPKKDVSQAHQYKLGEHISVIDDDFYLNADTDGIYRTSVFAWLSDHAKISLSLNKVPKSNVKLSLSIGKVSTYSQSVKLTVNGIPLDEETIYLGETAHEWIIPKEAITGKSLTLEFECPEATTYNGAVGNVAVGITDVTLVETNEKQIAETLPPPLNHKVTIAMGDQDAIDDAVLVRGLYQDGGDKAWTADRATFSFVAPPDMSGAAFTIAYSWTYYRELDAIVTLNGHELGHMHQVPYATETFNLPKEYFNKDGLQTIEVTVPNAVSPLEYGDSDDVRVLGLCVSTIEISPMNQYTLGDQISVSDDDYYLYAGMDGVYRIPSKEYAWLSDHAKISLSLNKAPKSNVKLSLSIGKVSTYSQSVKLTVNGIPLDEETICLGETAHEWIIPKEAITGKSLTLEFNCPEATIYNGVVGNVAVGISGLMLEETDEEQITKTLPPPLDHKVTVAMGDQYAIDDAVLVRGVYQDGGDIAWTTERATFSFVAPSDMNGAALTIAYSWTYYRELDAIVTLNGHELGHMHQVPYATETFNLPKEYFNQDGLQTIEVTVPNAVSPLEYGDSGDVRILGLCLSTVEIDPTFSERK